MAAIPALSVQELVKQPIITIPQHYVRLDQQPPTDPHGGRPFPTIPIIDMNQLVYGKDFDLQLHKLHSACKDGGFFQVLQFTYIFYKLACYVHEIIIFMI